MGCCGKDFNTGNCVCDILNEISDAQDDVIENCCDTGCEQSINDLLGDNDNANDLDTVPVLLYCGDGCCPFKGFGAFAQNIGAVVGSFYFRVKHVDKNCCVTLELLRDPDDGDANPCDPTSQMTQSLAATGICITVDAKCFCHITCLPAISAF